MDRAGQKQRKRRRPNPEISYFIQSKSTTHPKAARRPETLGTGAAILRSPVSIDAVRSIFGQGQVASVLSKIYVQMMIALCPIILHASYSTWMCID